MALAAVTDGLGKGSQGRQERREERRARNRGLNLSVMLKGENKGPRGQLMHFIHGTFEDYRQSVRCLVTGQVGEVRRTLLRRANHWRIDERIGTCAVLDKPRLAFNIQAVRCLSRNIE